jgi:hypothetical protein
MIHEMGSSFHYLNRGSWETHVQLVSLASRLETSHLHCAKPLKSPSSWPSSGLRNPNNLRPLHVDDDFLGHPNGLVSYGPPWAHYLGGYQDRLLGGPLGLIDLCRTVPVGVRRKDYGGEVLG